MLLAVRLPLLAGLLLAIAGFAPVVARANCFDPSREGDVVSFADIDEVRRFDVAAGVWLPPVPVGSVVRKVRTAGDTVWAKLDGSLVALDTTGAERFELAPDRDVVDFAVRDGHVFVLVYDPFLSGQSLRSYDAATGALESETGPTAHSGVIAVPGRVALSTFFRFDAVTYDPDGQLGELREVYPEGAVQKHVFRRAGEGQPIVTDGALFDPETLGVAEGYEGSAPAVWGDRLVTVWNDFGPSSLRLFDASRRFTGQRNLTSVGSVTGLFPVGDALWVFRCGPVGFQRVELADFAPSPPLLSPLPAAGFMQYPTSYATSEEGVLYFLGGDEPHVRRWLPAENRFLDSIPLREPARHVTRASGGGVLVTYASGRIGRIERGGESEVPFAWAPHDFSDDFESPVVAGPWTIVNDGDRWHAYDADGRWRSLHYQGGNASAAWDGERSRILWLDYPGLVLRTIDVDAEGRLAAGPVGPQTLEYPLAVSPANRLFAGGAILDLATFAPIADLGFGYYSGRAALWVTADLLVTMNGSTGAYREWTADGLPRGPEVILPGEPRAILPFDDERVVLVRQYCCGFGDRTSFDLVATGGDLDSDGIANGADDYPMDPGRHSDRDGDGVDDEADAFPDDPAETSDGDGDGLGDIADHLPDLGAERIARLSGEDWVGIAGLGRSDRDVEGQLHVFADGRYAFCTARETCLGGAWQTLRRDKGIGLTVAAEFLAGFGQSIQAGLARDLDRKVSFRFLAKRARGNVRTSEQGAVRLTLRAPHRGFVAGFGPFTGAYRIRVEGEWLELGTP
jgi:hypothetical protein